MSIFVSFTLGQPSSSLLFLSLSHSILSSSQPILSILSFKTQPYRSPLQLFLSPPFFVPHHLIFISELHLSLVLSRSQFNPNKSPLQLHLSPLAVYISSLNPNFPLPLFSPPLSPISLSQFNTNRSPLHLCHYILHSTSHLSFFSLSISILCVVALFFNIGKMNNSRATFELMWF